MENNSIIVDSMEHAFDVDFIENPDIFLESNIDKQFKSIYSNEVMTAKEWISSISDDLCLYFEKIVSQYTIRDGKLDSYWLEKFISETTCDLIILP